jgi:hypothetical protein
MDPGAYDPTNTPKPPLPPLQVRASLADGTQLTTFSLDEEGEMLLIYFLTA